MYRLTVKTSSFLICALGLLLSTTACVDGTSVEIGPTISEDGTPRTTAVTGVENPTAASLEEKIISDGARQLNAAGVKAHLSGKTQQWSNGGAYYHPDGALDFIWEGKGFYDYTWEADRDGLVCIRNPDGFTTSCSLYFDYQDTVWTVVIEVFGEQQNFFGGPDTVSSGNRLSDLEPWDPAMSGN